MQEQLRLAGIEIKTEFMDDGSLVSGHNIQLEQVLLNLYTNARDAIEMKDGDKTLKLGITVDETDVQITVEDSGGGIPDTVLPRIFEPFYTTKEMGKGTGLGLSVSYGIIRDMGGSIIAKNNNGGAQFTISLPKII
jgi:C4-dicarboxylate-specific signal transduction histidine kinase